MKINVAGIDINIECSGLENGPVVMMAHSLGCNLHMWDLQMSVLEPLYRVVRLDMRGQLADDVIGVMDHLKIDTAHWVGLSVGGMIGQSLLLRYPTRFLSAVLSDTASAQPAAAAPIWHARIQSVENDGLESIVNATMERWFTADFLAKGSLEADSVRAQLTSTSDNGYVACCHAIMNLDYIDRLSEIAVPVCLIVGAEDVATPPAGSQAMHERLPDSQLHILENASHIANVEQVESFNKALLPFLAKHA